MSFDCTRLRSARILGLLERKLDAAEEGFASLALAGGGCDTECNITAARQLHRIARIRGHNVVGLAVAELVVESREELLLAAIPGDDDLHTRQLPAASIQYKHL